MKWFKHISDSLDDPFIFDLIDRYGGDGYLVFFGTLEIYSREFKPELNWKLTITQSYLKKKLQKRQITLVVKILKHIQNSGKWDIEFDGDQISVFIPKFIQIIDDWTGRKLRSKSEPSQDKHAAIKNKNKNKNKNIPLSNKAEHTPSYTTKKYPQDFETFWAVYPNKKSKGQASKSWQKLKKSKILPDLDSLITGVNAAINSKEWIESGGKYIPHPSTWLNAHGWEDEQNGDNQKIVYEDVELFT